MNSTIELNVNVLWQNLIALNASLFKENEERGLMLIDAKKKHQEAIDEANKLRKKTEGYQQELMIEKNKTAQLTSKLETIRQLTEELFNVDHVDCEDIKPSFVESDGNRQFTFSARPNGSDVLIGQPKISLSFFPNGPSDNVTKSAVKDVADSNPDDTENEVDDEELQDENLLIPTVPIRDLPNKSSKNTCKQCGRKFQDQQRLKRHEVLHTGIRPFTCPVCQKTFIRSDQCKHHQRSVHPDGDQTSFSCSVCPETFTAKRLLISHNTTHNKKRRTESPLEASSMQNSI